MKTLTIAIAAVTVMTAFSASAEQRVKNTVIKQGDRKFFVVADPIRFAVVSGDLKTGPQGTFGRFPGEFETPAHTHSNAYRAVVISGKMTNRFGKESNPPVMDAGSFWSVAANAVHSTACVSKTPCEFFMFADKGFDFTPVK